MDTDTNSAKTDDWPDIEYADEWEAAGYTSDEARAWGMDPVYAQAWVVAGATVDDAHALHDAGVEPEEAEWWLTAGFDAVEVAAAHLATRGNPALDTWVQAGHTLDDAVQFVLAGIAPDEAHLFPPGPARDMLAALRPLHVTG